MLRCSTNFSRAIWMEEHDGTSGRLVASRSADPGAAPYVGLGLAALSRPTEEQGHRDQVARSGPIVTVCHADKDVVLYCQEPAPQDTPGAGFGAAEKRAREAKAGT